MDTNITPRKKEHAQPEKADKAQPSVAWYRPAVDVYEGDDGLLLVLDVPGVKPDALEVNVEGRTLTVSGLRSHGRAGWRRSFALPDGFDADKIVAKCEHGVLRLEVPKHEAAKPRKIAVK